MSVQLSSCAITIINKRPKSRPFCSIKPFNKLLILAFNVFDNDKTYIKIALFCQISDHFGAGTKYASCACRMHIASDYKYVLSEKCAKFFEIMFLNLCLCVCGCVFHHCCWKDILKQKKCINNFVPLVFGDDLLYSKIIGTKF